MRYILFLSVCADVEKVWGENRGDLLLLLYTSSRERKKMRKVDMLFKKKEPNVRLIVTLILWRNKYRGFLKQKPLVMFGGGKIEDWLLIQLFA